MLSTWNAETMKIFSLIVFCVLALIVSSVNVCGGNFAIVGPCSRNSVKIKCAIQNKHLADITAKNIKVKILKL